MTIDAPVCILPGLQQDAISRLKSALGKEEEDGKNDVHGEAIWFLSPFLSTVDFSTNKKLKPLVALLE